MEEIVFGTDGKQRTVWLLDIGIGALFAAAPFVAFSLMIPQIVVWAAFAWALLVAVFVPWMVFYHRILHYEVDDDEVRGVRGVVFRKHTTVPFTKVTNVDVTAGPFQRFAGIANVDVHTASSYNQAIGAEMVIRGVPNADELRDMIVRRVKAVPSTDVGDGAGPLATGPAPNGQFQRAMLDELQAIREALESRGAE